MVDELAKRPLLAGVPVSRLYPQRPDLENLLLVAVTELTTEADMDALVEGLRETCRA